MMEPIAVRVENAGALIEVSKSQFDAMLREHPELRAAVIRIPGLRGQRIHVRRLRTIVDNIAEEQGGKL